jgi:putative transcriptional regulator
MKSRSTTANGDVEFGPAAGRTDWARLRAMTDDEVMAAALDDPDAQPIKPEEADRFRPVPRVKRLRRRLGLTQLDFAARFGIPLGTLRDWEQDRCQPDGAALSLIRAIEREPETMLRLLQDAA